MGRLIAVSNRTAADHKSRAGGLAVAVWEALVSTQGLWFGWSGEVVGEPRGVQLFADNGVNFALANLTPEEHEGYYLHYANRVIWPVFHYRSDLARFDDGDFRTYAAVNERFAHLIGARVRNSDVIWIHDYHFLLLGEALRREGWQGRVGFFLHIPFPPPELFRTIPQHHLIARALCECNVIGFQSATYCANFTRYLVEHCGAEHQGDGCYRAFGRTVKIDAYPIGIDAEAFRAAVNTEKAADAVRRISRFMGGRRHIISVDRMDYSKGLPERFAALGKLLDDHPQMRGQLSFTQIAPPSRSGVEEYQELRRTLDGLTGRINGDYGDLDWLPLRYLARSFEREELAGLYSVSRVGLVTPLRDGMNLVAKEYVMAQPEQDPGVLVLSEFAGAAEQLDAAILVNPYDASAFAEGINMALQMPADERRERWQALRDKVMAQDVHWWRDKFLTDLHATRCT